MFVKFIANPNIYNIIATFKLSFKSSYNQKVKS